MQMLRLIITTAVIFGILAILIHELSPQYMTWVMSFPAVKTAVMKLHSVLNDAKHVIGDVFITKNNAESADKQKSKRPTKTSKERLFTAEELKKYDGKEESKGIYLALMGLVFNVKKGKKHYGPGGGYEFFAGRDASRAFVSGEFTEEGLTDDISGLTSADYIGLDEWVKFYHSDYKYIGKLIGRYYDENGKPTPYHGEAQKWIAEAYQQKEGENQEKKMFPPCNSEWTADSGSRLWCTTHSGGIERDWVGVPRKLYTPGQRNPRCACIKTTGPPSYDLERKVHDNRGDLDNPNLEEYAGCDPQAAQCYLPND